ncbi:MAG: hypothetical protein JXR31_11060 [Prolixibacteraceae bacterium]|nr:hypothetical protein [Prolixibacteraceae bacterium]
MKWIIKYYLICTFLSGIFLTKGFSEDKIFKRADSLMLAGQFRDARIELEKVIFFHNNQQITTEALIRKSDCYKNEQDFKKTYETLNRIFLQNLPDSLLFEVRYEKALAYFLNEEPGRAIFELQSLQKFLSDEKKALRITFLSAISYCDLKDWEEAKKESLEFLKLNVSDPVEKDSFQMQIDELFSEKNIPKTLSRQTAKNISMFIPGGGQFYSGKIVEGLFSFGLHGALFYFGVSQFLDKFYFTGYTAGFGLLQRLYTGNLQRVQDLVDQVNKTRHDDFFNEYFTILTAIAE